VAEAFGWGALGASALLIGALVAYLVVTGFAVSLALSAV
jgi:hypothetical protein